MNPFSHYSIPSVFRTMRPEAYDDASPSAAAQTLFYVCITAAPTAETEGYAYPVRLVTPPSPTAQPATGTLYVPFDMGNDILPVGRIECCFSAARTIHVNGADVVQQIFYLSSNPFL